jgi:hypothetical protein
MTKIQEEVYEALTRSNEYVWRSMIGISRQKNIPLVNVCEVLLDTTFLNNKKIITTLSRDGLPLYTTREQWENNTSYWRKIQSAIAGKFL